EPVLCRLSPTTIGGCVGVVYTSVDESDQRPGNLLKSCVLQSWRNNCLPVTHLITWIKVTFMSMFKLLATLGVAAVIGVSNGAVEAAPFVGSIVLTAQVTNTAKDL